MLTVPKVSVLITVYNSGKFIGNTLEKLSKQTMKDFEVVCVDDGSTDNSVNIIEQRRAVDKRIKLVRQENTGVGGARKTAVNHAVADYVLPLDHDDSISDDALETSYEEAINTDSAIVLLDLYSDSSDGKREKLIDLDCFKWPMEGRLAMQLTLSSWMLHGAGLYKKELYSSCYNHCRVDLYNADEYVTRVLLYKAPKVSRASGKYYYFSEPTSLTRQFNIRHLEFLDTQYELFSFLKSEDLIDEMGCEWVIGTFKWIRILNKKLRLYRKSFTKAEVINAERKIKLASRNIPKGLLFKIIFSTEYKVKYRFQSILTLFRIEYYLYKLNCNLVRK
ncbi:glycosyltransferase family 2 protein [Kistimonas asteriae]|uniref:glycosyltransferase family 2 protein n=1 Tax=Kistimonas asteriae TaxID=517724 RepID=UPI001BAD0E79|nr:glycosyltransferase family 2 protein [Kistimonas asteriae]